ncbi:hypothetical protein [Bacillus cereus]|uniref:hypothetical protein n=1 Tax=Bacillus cereus TaxID=1396 RepID=UPI0015E80BE1|nr:hypothetical protein [Bacillus cereus]
MAKVQADRLTLIHLIKRLVQDGLVALFLEKQGHKIIIDSYKDLNIKEWYTL